MCFYTTKQNDTAVQLTALIRFADAQPPACGVVRARGAERAEAAAAVAREA